MTGRIVLTVLLLAGLAGLHPARAQSGAGDALPGVATGAPDVRQTPAFAGAASQRLLSGEPGGPLSRFEAADALLAGRFSRATPAEGFRWLPAPWMFPPRPPQQPGPGIAVDPAAELPPLAPGLPVPAPEVHFAAPARDAGGEAGGRRTSDAGASTPLETSAGSTPDASGDSAAAGYADTGSGARELTLAAHAYGAYQRGFYEAAATLALKAAAAGQPAAQTLLGVLHENGFGMRQDFQAAAGWYALAAELDEPRALHRLGALFLEGRGVPESLGRAADLLERAADLGDPEAAHSVGLLYLRGEGRERDPAAAFRYIRAAAEAEIADAQYTIAVMYEEGEGVAPDDRAATEWLRRAAENGHVSAMVEYAIRLFNGRGTEPDEEKAAALFRRAALLGNPVAMNRYARLLALGRGVAPDETEAAKWHLLAREQGVYDLWLDGFVGTRSASVLEEAERRAKTHLN